MTGLIPTWGVLPAALATALTPPPTDGPDAELITLCQEFNELERQSNAAFDKAEEEETIGAAAAAAQPFLNRQRPLLKKIVELHAITPAGLEARVKMMTGWYRSFWEEILIEEVDIAEHGNWRSIMLAAFIRDAIGHEFDYPAGGGETP
jgi:hypothetical protein